jgi:hypothetical protein
MIQFRTLWDTHPSNAAFPDSVPCRTASGAPAYAHQCAIRLGVALSGAGATFRSYVGALCRYHPRHRHVLRAEELAAWLRHHPEVAGHPRITRHCSQSTFVARRGLILCRNFWGPGNTGDHIDAWNGTRMAGGDASYIELSEEVWFWEIV